MYCLPHPNSHTVQFLINGSCLRPGPKPAEINGKHSPAPAPALFPIEFNMFWTLARDLGGEGQKHADIIKPLSNELWGKE